MNKTEKIRHGNIETWKKKREAFFKSDPRCSECGDKLTNYTRTGKCWRCRVNGNHKAFTDKNADYHKKYNKIRDKKRWIEEKARRNKYEEI